MFGLKLLRNRARGATSFFGWKPISSALADNKAYIRVSGTESKKFLQGICTFDTARLEKEGNCVPGLFLTPKGRILADAIVYEVPNKSDSGVRDIIIETAKDSVNTLFQQLRLYRMRSKIGLEIISDVSTLLTSRKCQKSSPDVAISASASAGASTGDGDGDGDGAETEAKASIHMFPIDSILCQSQDPRMKVEFLDRLLVHMSVEQAAECVKKSEQGKDTLIPVVVSSDLDTSRPLSLPGKDQDEVVDSAADWYANIRVIYGVSEGLECISKIPLEFNFDLLRAIDFNKGCYVGQELTARTKHQGLVRKRVVPFVLDKSFLSASSGSFAHLSESGLETLLKTGWKSKPQAIDAQSSSPLLSKGCKLYARKAGSLENNPAKVGEIICMNANASVGLSMFRVGHLLDSTNEYFVHVDHVASNADNNGSSSGNDSEDENSSATPDTGSGEWLPVFPYRPQWWLDNDPLTGNPVISCK